MELASDNRHDVTSFGRGDVRLGNGFGRDVLARAEGQRYGLGGCDECFHRIGFQR